MQVIAVAGLVRLDLPGPVTVRLSDGAAVRWSGEGDFLPSHATYGAIASVESLAEGIGDEVPAMQLVLHPPSTTAAADLVQPGAQQSRVRCWVARYDSGTGEVDGTPALLFDGFLDQARLTRGRGKFELAISVVSLLERLFELNIGNGLSPTFHKSVWPGETGEDQATGLVLQDAWGVESPTPQIAYGGGGIYSGTPSWSARVAKK